ncbi:hypothetical protein [Streptomyces telluris]|uniref:Cytochrome C oxidase subunit I n=1 Tax=Streptomyces telluris TaxID=2720021 RepID=A0A9X2LEC1_9ACTN|nr:hypothetical protein [Streptomyces telluris]MCQ8769387.1 hypothetical protein [Streptomyces telluris]NJP82834.1 hypothetical protein [Streptomyces telluris]
MRTTAEAVNEIEGYLLWEEEKRKAGERAREFTAGIPWLTDSQRADLEHRYTVDRLAASRTYLRRIAARSTELRAEYETVYQALKRRAATWFVVCGVVWAAAVLALR